ncbi:MAG: putative Na+/H+ antiporter [Candidatus Gracilibacteria bacterium]|nr:putative Na+/H+ antiporter [Candidatus Gracilibacteria bacterium]
MTVQQMARALFVIAIVHTLFLTGWFNKLAHNHPEGSIRENLYHFLGEAEVVFGLWAAVFFFGIFYVEGIEVAVGYLEGKLKGKEINFIEPVFVFVVMAMASTRPILELAETVIEKASKLLPMGEARAFYVSALILGPLLGSFITEPAAMTVTALLLLKRYYSKGISEKLKYATLGILFVNISIGGTLSHFAAPPVLMVAAKWGWGMSDMIGSFGYKAAIAVVLNTLMVALLFKDELESLSQSTVIAFDPTLSRKKRKQLVRKSKKKDEQEESSLMPVTWWLTLCHIVFLAVAVYFNHHMVIFIAAFLFFLGLVQVTQEYQKPPELKGPILVGFFLGGLVTLGGFQAWWLQPILEKMDDLTLFVGATSLTAITDNAALTYLGTLIEGLSESARFALVAGAVSGGGLTVMANAPNPAGNSILGKSFEEGITAVGLFKAAFIPTLVAMACIWLLPSIGGSS